MNTHSSRRFSILHTTLRMLVVAAAATCVFQASGKEGQGPSVPVTEAMREALPAEKLSCSVKRDAIIIRGPTYEYRVAKNSGAIAALRATREGQPVVELAQPADIIIGNYHLARAENSGRTAVVTRRPEQVVLQTAGVLKAAAEPDLPYTLRSTFFNDGMVVSQLTLSPRQDLAVKEIRHQVIANGVFRHYLHKGRESYDIDAFAALPAAGQSARKSTLTSCLQVLSPKAALAILTDSGGMQLAPGADSATLEVQSSGNDRASVALSQYVVNGASTQGGCVLKANNPFTFRVGMCVAPNRLPNPYRRAWRMFAWIGDEKNPYPSDKEIQDAAQLGCTLFQMHRLGTPGEPRPPAAEFDRVLKTVHQAGMLFLWTANADLMYHNAPGVAELQRQGKWALWQGFNYDGRYVASMDKYCDLIATCLASPNGLADYRVACNARMLARYPVDGMYIDDNLAYPNCTLWKEHGHPHRQYDCLIELHEMNWRRRQQLRAACPHAVLIDHCTTAMVLPAICDFDVHLFGEGYGYATLEHFRSYFAGTDYMYAQGCMWAGGTETARCVTETAYAYDLLTGGGRYCYSDWRLYPKKFPHASGVTPEEPGFVRTYNRAQYYFGTHEATVFDFAEAAELFAATAPKTYATFYRNEAWKDWLLAIANLNAQAKETTLTLRSPQTLDLKSDGNYVLFDVVARKLVEPGVLLRQAPVTVPGQSLKLFYIRQVPPDRPFHLWGGQRLSEKWSAGSGTLTVKLCGPVGLEEEVFLRPGAQPLREVKVNGKPADFCSDTPAGLSRIKIRFSAEPVRVEVRCGAPRE